MWARCRERCTGQTGWPASPLVAVSVVAEGDFPEILDVTDLEPVELRQQTEPEVELDHDLRDLDGMRSVLFSISLYFEQILQR